MNFRETNKYLIIFPNCIPVKGFLKSSICDFGREQINLFPSSYFNLLADFEKHKVKKIFSIYDVANHENIQIFIQFLLDNEYAFFSEHKQKFPKIDIIWKSPELINNAIIDIGNEELNLEGLILQLAELQCKYLQIRSYSEDCSLKKITQLLKKTENSTSIEGVDLILKYNKYNTEDDYCEFFQNNLLVSSLYIHSYETSKTLNVYFNYSGNNESVKKSIVRKIFFTNQIISDASSCGIISSKYFNSSSIQDFSHNKCHNSCLHKKIAIDQNGNIKNCPSMTSNYGNIDDKSIVNIAKSKSFQKLWNVTKDQISVCKDCEFRYVCTDCRAYLEDPQDILSKPLKCGYDPYKGVWENWSTNSLKLKAKEYYQIKL